VQFFGWLIEPLLFAAHKTAAISAPLTLAFTPPKMFIVLFYVLVFGLAGFSLRQFKWPWNSRLQPAPVERIWRDLWRSLKAAAPLIVILLMFLSLVLQRGWFGPARLEVTFLDVGQGSSTVVRFPDGRVTVVDGGGFMNSDFDIGKFVIAPYLWQRGISRIDWLVLTHAHPDHFKGLAYLAEEFSPKALLWNGVPPSPLGGEGGGEGEVVSGWDEFIERVKKAGVPISVVIPAGVSGNPVPISAVIPAEVSGNPVPISAVIPAEVSGNPVNTGDPRFRGDDFHFQFLSPPSPIPPDWDLNNTSLVMLITHGDVSFLLTGDIGSSAEKYVAELLTTNDQRLTTVLQVPHHGSGSSSTAEFLEAVRPQYAVIQLGEDNRYRFPNEGVLERLKRIGAKIYRTDKNGAIEFKTDGKDVVVHCKVNL
jgi:competence protein ComEC